MPEKNTEASRLSVVLVLAVGLGWLLCIWLWRWAYLTLTVDDSFYYLQTAKNAARGYGFTFDQLNPTNGFHPLWMWLLVVVQKVTPGDPAFVMRLVLTLQLGLVVVGIGLLRRLGHLQTSYRLVGLALLFSNFYVTKILINGQESALQFFLLVVTLYLWQRTESAELSRPGVIWRHGLLLGLVMGCTALARLEALGFCLALWAMPFLWPAPNRPSLRQRGFVALLSGAVCFLVVGSYLLSNLLTFSHLLPVSGAIKLGQGGRLSVWIRALVAVVLGLMVVAPWWWRQRLGQSQVRVLRRSFPLLVYIAMLAFQHTVVQGKSLPAIWYLVPHLLFLIIAGDVFLSRLGQRPGRMRWLAVAAGLWLFVGGGLWLYRLHPDSYAIYAARRRAGLWLRTQVSPQRDLVAGWDCGIAAAFYDGRLINLDGLINSWRYKTRYLDWGLTQAFIDRVHRVDYIVQHMPLHAISRLSRMRWRGVDLSRWHVLRAECVRGRVLRHPFETRLWVQLILSRHPTSRSYIMTPEIAKRVCQ